MEWVSHFFKKKIACYLKTGVSQASFRVAKAPIEEHVDFLNWKTLRQSWGQPEPWEMGRKSQIGESLVGKPQILRKLWPDLWLTLELHMCGAHLKCPVKEKHNWTKRRVPWCPEIGFQLESNQVNCLVKQKYQHCSKEHNRIQSLHPESP